MVKFIAGRLVRMIFVMWGVVTVVFIILRLSGDPVSAIAPDYATAEEIEMLNQQYGFDQPLHIQYRDFLAGVLQADFGHSIRYRRPATAVLLDHVGATFTLAAFAMACVLLIAIPLGFFAARHRDRAFDHAATGLVLLGDNTPTFFLGIIFILVFAEWLGVVPSGGSGGSAHMILPVATLAAASTAGLARMTRSEVVQVLTRQYVRTARAKGIGRWRIVSAHVMKNALIPVVTLAGLVFGQMLSGAVVVETVFGWPGIGNLVLSSISTRDYAVVQAVVCLIALLFVVVNTAVDILYRLLDPRIVKI